MDDRAGGKEITTSKKIALVALQVVLALAALALAVWQIGSYTNSLDPVRLIHGLPWLVLAGLVYVLFYFVLALHWQYICRIIEPNASRYQWLALFAAQPYKYLPTSIFTLTFRAKYAKKLGMSLKKSSLGQLVENVSMLASAVSLVALVWCTLHDQSLLGVALFVVGLAIFAVGFEVLSRVKYGMHFSLRSRVTMFAITTVSWLIAGIAFWIVAIAFHQSVDVVSAIGANTAAVEAGIIAIFAPGGIGVREFVFGLFGVGAIVIIAWRLVTAIVDVVIGPISWYVIRRLQEK